MRGRIKGFVLRIGLLGGLLHDYSFTLLLELHGDSAVEIAALEEQDNEDGYGHEDEAKD